MKRRLGTLACMVFMLFLVGCAPAFPSEETSRYAMDPDVFTIPREYTVAQLTAESDVILLGKVDHCREGGNATQTTGASCNSVAVKVEQTLLGDVQIGETVWVTDTGYTVTEEGVYKEVSAFGGAMLQKNYRVVLFLQIDPDNASYDVTAYELGKWIVDKSDTAYCSMVFSPMPEEGKTWGPSMSDMRPIPLSTLLDDIRAALP